MSDSNNMFTKYFKTLHEADIPDTRKDGTVLEIKYELENEVRKEKRT
jgi:hypothetical protein